MRRAYTIGAPSICVNKNGLGRNPEFRDQGVGGSNPLSPTISFQALAKWLGHEGLRKRVYIDRVDCWPGVNSRQALAAAKLTASTRSSHPRAVINVLRYIHRSVTHVVARDFGPDAAVARADVSSHQKPISDLKKQIAKLEEQIDTRKIKSGSN
jgi:hypothetical protein